MGVDICTSLKETNVKSSAVCIQKTFYFYFKLVFVKSKEANYKAGKTEKRKNSEFSKKRFV